MAKRKKKAVDLSKTWEIGLGRTAMVRMAKEPRFHALLALCRLVNLLRFVQAGIIGTSGSNSPFARRQSLISFSLSCALLYEAYQHVVPALGKVFKNDVTFLEGLSKWRSDPQLRGFIEGHCKPLRHTATFHFDVAPVGERLAGVRSDWTRVLSSRGTMQGFYYYDLADIVALMAFWGDLGSGDAVANRVAELASQTARATVEFLNAADNLVGSVIAKPPFRLKQADDTSEPDWLVQQMKRDGRVDEAQGRSRHSRRV